MIVENGPDLLLGFLLVFFLVVFFLVAGSLALPFLWLCGRRLVILQEALLLLVFFLVVFFLVAGSLALAFLWLCGRRLVILLPPKLPQLPQQKTILAISTRPPRKVRT